MEIEMSNKHLMNISRLLLDFILQQFIIIFYFHTKEYHYHDFAVSAKKNQPNFLS